MMTPIYSLTHKEYGNNLFKTVLPTVLPILISALIIVASKIFNLFGINAINDSAVIIFVAAVFLISSVFSIRMGWSNGFTIYQLVCFFIYFLLVSYFGFECRYGVAVFAGIVFSVGVFFIHGHAGRRINS
ncbi:MAG: hypothetical protein AB1717_02705 [Pseudomonadota bacterium]